MYRKLLTLIFIWLGILFICAKIVPKSWVVNRENYETESALPVKLRSTILPLLNFDGRNYLDISLHGYQINQLGQDRRAFFPLFPLIGGTLNRLHIPLIPSILFINLVSLFLSLLILQKLTKNKSFWPVILLLSFPTAFFLITFYTESLFLLEVLAFFYFLKTKQLGRASLIAGLATATRLTGLSLVAVLVYYLWNQKELVRKFYLMILSVSGLLAYCLYLYFTTGDPLRLIAAQRTFGRPVDLISIFTTPLDWLTRIIFEKNILEVKFISSLELISYLTWFVFLVYSWKKISHEYWLYSFISFTPYALIGNLSSGIRYLAVIFPIFLLIPTKIKNKAVLLLISIFFLILQISLFTLFFRNHWVA